MVIFILLRFFHLHTNFDIFYLFDIGTIRDEGIGSIKIADFILYMLNKHSVFDYVEYMELEHPYDDTMEMLCDYAKKKNWYRKLSKRYTGMCRL